VLSGFRSLTTWTSPNDRGREVERITSSQFKGARRRRLTHAPEPVADAEQLLSRAHDGDQLSFIGTDLNYLVEPWAYAKVWLEERG
jgi:hypothetical protein